MEEDGAGGVGGAGAMADAVLDGGGELGHGAAELGEEEDGVVAEAAGTGGLEGDEAGAEAGGGLEEAVGMGEGDGAAEAGGAGGPGDAGELLEEQAVAVGVGEAGSGVAGGVEAGATAEGIDLETRVIGEGDQAGGVGEGDGLEAGVGEVGGAVLIDVEVKAEVGGAETAKGEAVEERLIFAYFARVGGGDEQVHGWAGSLGNCERWQDYTCGGRRSKGGEPETAGGGGATPGGRDGWRRGEVATEALGGEMMMH